MTKTNPRRFQNLDYIKLCKTINGHRILIILKVLLYQIKTRAEIENATGFSTSTVARLLLKAKKQDFVKEYEKNLTRSPGKPKTGDFEKETGRPAIYYGLSSKGVDVLADDPEVIPHWDEVKKFYGFPEVDIFDSLENLLNAFEANPILKEFDKPWFDVSCLQVELFDRFIYVPNYKAEKITDDTYAEVAKVLDETIPNQLIYTYFSGLEERALRLERILERHRRLLDKLKKSPKIKNHLEMKKS